MSNIDISSASGKLGALRWLPAYAVYDEYTITMVSPEDGSAVGALAVALKMLVSSSGALDSDVQVQVAEDDSFSSIIWSPTFNSVGDGLIAPLVSSLSDDTEYWWRARVAEEGSGVWGSWTDAWSFRVRLNASRGSAYVYSNVGLEPGLEVASVPQYVYENIGIETTLESSASQYVYENIGVEISKVASVSQYIYEGDVDEGIPFPHIWFLRPNSGRPGDGIKIVGFGFGDLPTDYSGIVQIYIDGQWLGVPVVSWQTFPPTGEAYEPERQINEFDDIVDPQHQIVEIVIPNDAVEPGHPVRIRTED